MGGAGGQISQEGVGGFRGQPALADAEGIQGEVLPEAGMRNIQYYAGAKHRSK